MANPTVQRRLKQLAAAVKAEPGSIPRRLELAQALREAGRAPDAIEMYRGVAEAYADEGRLVQAMAICRGILEIDPQHLTTLEMVADFAAARAADAPPQEEITARGEDRERTPTGEEVSDVRTAMWGQTPPLGVVRIDTGVAIADSAFVDTDPGRAAVESTDPQLRVKPPATEAAGQQDFPVWTKARARGNKLLEFVAPPAGGDEIAATAPTLPPPPTSDKAVEPTQAASRRARAATAPEELDPLPSLPSAHVAKDDELEWDDDEGHTLIESVLSSPVPRSGDIPVPAPFPLFSELPRAAFLDLVSRMTVLRLPGGESILREGEIGDACYVISRGSVRVHKGDVELAVLGVGSVFGEFAVLADQRRHASVDAVDDVELLELRRALLDELVAKHPGVARTLRRFYRERLLQTLLATAPFFASLTPAERLQISERFRPRRFGRGARIIEQGSAGGGLFLILVGDVQVVHQSGEAEVVLSTLGEGCYFGEMSLLKGGAASATVRAGRLTEVVQLPPRDFYEVVSQHPVLWEHLRKEAERRAASTHNILSGTARGSSDGNIYLV